MEGQIDNFCTEFGIPEQRVIRIMNGCLSHIGQHLLYELNSGKKDVACQTDPEMANIPDWTQKNVSELKVICKTNNLVGYSKMKKNELIDLIHDNQIKAIN